MLAIMRIRAMYILLDVRNPMPRLAAMDRNREPSAVLVDKTTWDLVLAAAIPLDRMPLSNHSQVDR